MDNEVKELTAKQEDYLLEEARERQEERDENSFYSNWLDDNRYDLKVKFLEEKQEEYKTFNQDRDEEFIDENFEEFDKFCKEDFSNRGE